MFESINIYSRVPVYVQIENHVQFAVASGRLKAGDRLPSVRELAAKLKVNFPIIAMAYRDLEVMGVVYSRRTLGVFIQKGVEARCAANCRARIVARIFETVGEGKAAGMTLQDLKEVCVRTYASEAEDPYGEVPKAVLALAKS